MLVPQLVTGCKIWHMRPAGVFYPKHSFDNMVAKLPSGAQVRLCGHDVLNQLTKALLALIPAWHSHIHASTMDDTLQEALHEDHARSGTCAQPGICSPIHLIGVATADCLASGYPGTLGGGYVAKYGL